MFLSVVILGRFTTETHAMALYIGTDTPHTHLHHVTGRNLRLSPDHGADSGYRASIYLSSGGTPLASPILVRSSHSQSTARLDAGRGLLMSSAPVFVQPRPAIGS